MNAIYCRFPGMLLILGHNHAKNAPRLLRQARLLSEVANDVKPPMRRHRDAVSVLRALNSCVEPLLGLPDYRTLAEPWLGSGLMTRNTIQAKVAGRNAARYVARQFLPNDLSALATKSEAKRS